MDLHQVEGYSSSESGNIHQQNRQTFRMEPTNMTKSVEQQNCRQRQLQSHENIQEQLHQAENGLQPDPDVGLEHQEYAGTSLLCESNHPDLVQKAESVVTKVTAEAINLMKYQVEKKIQYLDIDYKIKELYEQDKIAKIRSIEIQMENEGLSQEKDLELKSYDRKAVRITNTLEICKLLKEHYEKLHFTAEQVEKLRNEFCVQYALLTNDLKTQRKNRKALAVEYVNNVERLKKTVEEEHQLRISEINNANSNYQGQVKCLSEKMLLLNNEEEKYSSLNVQDEELDISITQEELNLKEKLGHAYESLHFFLYKNETLESEVNSYKGKEKELEDSLHSITVERDCIKRQVIDLEEFFETVSNEEKMLNEELNTVKERLTCHETENSGTRNQEDTYEKENLDLLQQMSQYEDKHKDVNRKLEDTRTKYACLTQDLTNLTVKLEIIQTENQTISNRYRSELSDLESALEIHRKEADAKHTKIKDQNNIVNVLQQEFVEENSAMKSHQLKLQSLKTNMADEEAKMETLRSFIQEEKTILEEVNKFLMVRQSEVKKLREETERKLQEHTDYKKEMLMAVNQTREETKAVKEKQEKRDLERDGKRQEIMRGLRECRNASIKQADEKEAELDAQRKMNFNLKEKLHNIINHKESIERDSEIQRKMLECKIKQLQMDLENEITQSEILSKSQTCEQVSTSVQKRFGSVKKIGKLQSSDPGKKRRLEVYQQSEKVRTGGTKDEYLQSLYRATPRKYEVKSGHFKSSRRKQHEPLDILSSL
ncbi:coiled-coil domain-containing protein 186-like isoform X2 [Zootermopsis nevadensis]|uniref:coiled-coil domain-containing protein 186-like isoform X2 n=1 Tax=Zootermopsis nevadensis TaxID=136037 RepID=UPI000B8E5E5D|nr:coiled-coil domain-containing protein 186-like isoform X2 [Zootermopsis nevadensis]